MQIRVSAGTEGMQVVSLAATFTCRKTVVADGPLIEFLGAALASDEVSGCLE